MHGPRDRDRLALSAGEHRDLRAHGAQRANPDVLDVAAGALPHLTVRQPAERADPARQLAVQEHVVRDRERRDQREILVDGVDPERARVVDRAEVHLLAVDEDPAGVGPVEPAQDLDQRRLAGAVVADQAEALSLAEAERDVDEGRDGAEALRDALDPDRGGRLGAHCSLPRFRRRATCTLTIIDAMIAIPMIRSKVNALTPMMLNPVRRITSTATPMKAPITEP